MLLLSIKVLYQQPPLSIIYLAHGRVVLEGANLRGLFLDEIKK